MAAMGSVDDLEQPAPIGERVCQPILDRVRARNEEVWRRQDHWWFGFYFGDGDTRLWVPARERGGAPHPQRRVLNFMHPLGRKPFGILMLAYLSLALLVLYLAAWAAGTS